MPPTHTTNRRDFIKLTGLAALGAAQAHGATPTEGRASERFPALAGVGNRYRFAIIADPQLGHADDTNRVPANARRTLIQSVQELNAMPEQPAFVVFLGDLVNAFNEKSVANFEACIEDLKAPRVIVHGNHDTHPPYTDFRALMKRQCGFDDVFYSFDAGPWHFVVLPCNLYGNNDAQREIEAAMLAWLEEDLAANAAKPTVVFEHLHTLPIGLAQSEWYTFPLALRRKLMDLYVKHGNVRWYFNGHVHNGFQVSVKTSWHYRGINFVNCPTIIEMRNFGEEDPRFVKGIDEAGYYLLVSVDGEKLSIEGRRAGQAETFAYPDTYRTFEDAHEPRWWTPIAAMPAETALVNGAFDSGIAGWRSTYRYPADKEPGSEIVPVAHGVRITTRSKVSHFWANDEYTEIYQLIQCPKRPVIETAYTLDADPVSGGGYLRAFGLSDNGLEFHMMWHWGEQERKADYFPRCVGYMIDGVQMGWNFFNDLGAKKRALTWKLAGGAGEHKLFADLGALYDAAVGAPGAFAQLAVERLFIGAGTWANKDDDAFSAATFKRVAMAEASGDTIQSCHAFDGQSLPLATDAAVFQCDFAADLIERGNKRQHRPV